MALSITISNQIKAYNLAVCPTVPEFMEEALKTSKSLKKNELFRKRIEVIQDFEFPTAATQIVESKDSQFIVASGIYKPTLKIFDTAQLSLKVARGLDSEIVKFCLLDDDFKKIAIACEDRNIEFHAQYGKHYKTRVPKQPTDMVYHKYSSDLYTSSQSDMLHRLNLETGGFVDPIELTQESGVNALEFHDDLQLLLAGGNQNLNVIDLRSKGVARVLPLPSKVTSLATNNLTVAVGSEDGSVKLFDLRKQAPISVFQHQYRLPIRKLQINSKHNMLVSADSKILKFYNLNNGQLFTNIEPTTEINSFTWIKDSGLFLLALEQPRMGVYFIPQLDPAPRWCPFLDNLTEELEEEDTQTVYDEFKFLSYEELEHLDALHLLDTKMLKQYMHGYLIHLKLYLKLREQKGLDYVDFKQKRIQQQIARMTEQERVSKGYAAEVEEVVNDDEVIDDRFKQMKFDQDYEVDKTSKQYKRLHASERQGGVQGKGIRKRRN